MDGETCGTCRFWERLEPVDESQEDSRCLRYPPVPDVLGAIELMREQKNEGFAAHAPYAIPAGFPACHSDDWCGEHQPRKPLPVV